MVQTNSLTPYNSIMILGPTASGKTAISLQVAKKLNGEIISADSMQFYKGLDIGTAKATKEEQNTIKHHCIDILDWNDTYNVANFRIDVEQICKNLSKEGKTPVIVGGSGFYVKTLLDPEFQDIDLDYTKEKEKLSDLLEKKYSDHQLYEMLQEKDAQLAKSIHPNNKKRVLNYLIKLILQEKEPKSVYHSQFTLKPCIIVLCPERFVLYERINTRVDQMMQEGLLQEAKMVYDTVTNPHAQCLGAIGYKEFFPYFKQKKSLEECIDILKQKTRNYAKRQITWLKHQVSGAVWYDPMKEQNLADIIVRLYQKTN